MGSPESGSFSHPVSLHTNPTNVCGSKICTEHGTLVMEPKTKTWGPFFWGGTHTQLVFFLLIFFLPPFFLGLARFSAPEVALGRRGVAAYRIFLASEASTSTSSLGLLRAS